MAKEKNVNSGRVLFGIATVAAGLFGFHMLASAETIMPLPYSGGHNGEQPSIAYRVDYVSPFGITSANAAGITYAPFGFPPTFEPTVLPERYFGSYALYFAGGPFSFVLHLKNTGKRTYRNLLVIAAQEFLNIGGGAGVPFPGDAAHNWFVPKLGPGEEVALYGALTLPTLGSSGIDQTHLQILHWENDETVSPDVGTGRVLLDDPQAGLWCPLR